MVHAENCVPTFHFAGNEDGIGRKRANNVKSRCLCSFERGGDHFNFFSPHVAGFTCVRIEPGDCNDRVRNTEVSNKRTFENGEHLIEYFRCNCISHVSERQMGGSKCHLERILTRRRGEHHHDTFDAGKMLKKFSVAGKCFTGFREDAFLRWGGNNGRISA